MMPSANRPAPMDACACPSERAAAGDQDDDSGPPHGQDGQKLDRVDEGVELDGDHSGADRPAAQQVRCGACEIGADAAGVGDAVGDSEADQGCEKGDADALVGGGVANKGHACGAAKVKTLRRRASVVRTIPGARPAVYSERTRSIIAATV